MRLFDYKGRDFNPESGGVMRKHVKNNVSWIGYMDWELKHFHGDEYTVNNGSSQNAYLIEEEKTVLMDTVWKPHAYDFVENLREETDLNSIDCIIINHGEVDHSGALVTLMKEIPDTPIYCTANCVTSLKGQFKEAENWNLNVVKTGDSLDIGNGKKLVFVEMRMLHWPDSMATYMTGDNILFSMDAFGQHFAVEELFNDLADQEMLFREAIKYYANILNPFSPLVKKKLAEITALNLPIDIIATSHGVIWRDNPMQIIEKYAEWADNYQENQITIIYDTMWESTAMLASEIAHYINELDPSVRVKVYNIAKSDRNNVATEVFKSKAIAVGSSTCGCEVLPNVESMVHFMKTLKFKGKKAAAFGSYGWSGEAVKLLKERLAKAGFEVVDSDVNVKWVPTPEELKKCKAVAEALVK
jgi:anaerobic nitric oxide reductase flavorubredoxin